MERITSRQNAIVKRFRELAHGAHADGSGEILLDGEHLLEEALACRVPIDTAAFSDRHAESGPLSDLMRRVSDRGARVIIVSDRVLAAMSPVQHPSGVVATARLTRATMLDAFSAVPDGAPPLVVILAGLQDPGNVGAIVRSAAAFGATGIAAVEGSANPFGWKALRGAMGGTFRLPVASGGTLFDAIAMARQCGTRLLAAVPRGGTPLPRLELRASAAIAFGGEGAGLSEAIVAAADEAITIPMRAPVESLNVATAAALTLYEAARQREPGERHT